MGDAPSRDRQLPWHIISCLWPRRSSNPRSAENVPLTIFRRGFARGEYCDAEIQTSRHDGANDPQHHGCFADVGNRLRAHATSTEEKWQRDDTLHHCDASSSMGKESRQPWRETSQSMEQNSIGGQRRVRSSNRLKEEWDSREITNIAREESPTVSCADDQAFLIEQGQPALPDDVVELCLARMSFNTLGRARMVCRKWRDLTMSPHFLAGREKLSSRQPWLLLFGVCKDGASSEGEIHALDVHLNQWHSIQADALSGRSLFSVASLNGLVYVLGGCSSLCSGDGNPRKASVETQKDVLVYNPFRYSWTKGCSMKYARAMAVTGVFEIKDMGMAWGRSKSFSSSSCQRKGFGSMAQADMVVSSGTVGDRSHQKPSANPACIMADDGEGSRKPSEIRNGLIVVGGQGQWNQPLHSAEIFDLLTNSWREVARLPADLGIICTGVVCNGRFYVYSETDKLAAYDFQLDVWTSIQVSNGLARVREYSPKLVACKGKLILVGVAWGSMERSQEGARGGAKAATRMLWEFHHCSQTWRPVAKHPDAPLDCNAVSICEGEQVYGLEMFKIFGQVLDFVTVCDLSGPEAAWRRLPRMRFRNGLDVSSRVAKTAVVVRL